MISKAITGGFFIFLGVVLAVLGFVFSFWFWAYSVICLLIGLLILFNKEEQIEKIREVRKKR